MKPWFLIDRIPRAERTADKFYEFPYSDSTISTTTTSISEDLVSYAKPVEKETPKMVSNVIEMVTWTDAVGQTGFVQDWTIFYWAWWMAFAPYVGIFVARISKGRTIRDIIFSMCIFGSLGGWLFMIILGNLALNLELTNALPVVSMIESDVFAAIASIIVHLPFGGLALALFMVVTIIYVATTYDSTSYTLAAAATKELHQNEDPSKYHRLFWALILGILPIILMYIGGLKVVQSAVLLAGLPIAIACVFMTRTLIRWLREDHP
jgi:BCCT family betaine/carnitine transporter